MKNWKNLAVTDVVLAVRVAAGEGRATHTDRPSHGLVLGDRENRKEYFFADGTVLKTQPGSLLYLPKGSSYQVKNLGNGGCYAINFQADGLPPTAPFVITLRDFAPLEKCFREACSAWKEQRGTAALLARRCLYEAVLCGVREQERQYLPTDKAALLAPAEIVLQKRYTDPALNIGELAAACGISETYFRRLFRQKYAMSPHEHLSRMRVTYAVQLLESGQFSVEQVARLCGFAEPCHFSREFRRRVGVSPMRYRQDG